MEGFTLWKARARLTRELASWRMAAIGLLALAVLVNVAMMARITHLEDAREADAVRHQEELRQAEQARELAVQELGTPFPPSLCLGFLYTHPTHPES